MRISLLCFIIFHIHNQNCKFSFFVDVRLSRFCNQCGHFIKCLSTQKIFALCLHCLVSNFSFRNIFVQKRKFQISSIFSDLDEVPIFFHILTAPLYQSGQSVFINRIRRGRVRIGWTTPPPSPGGGVRITKSFPLILVVPSFSHTHTLVTNPMNWWRLEGLSVPSLLVYRPPEKSPG